MTMVINLNGSLRLLTAFLFPDDSDYSDFEDDTDDFAPPDDMEVRKRF